MKKVVLVPDSFKGTMSSAQVCDAMAEGIHAVFPAAEVISLPVADGGEGSAEAFLTALGGARVSLRVTGPEGAALESFYALLPDGTAVVEMAAAAGLPQVLGQKDPERTTTFGVGELLRHAAHHGAKRAVMCLGGSATNDGGCGAAAACGVRFLDRAGNPFVPVGGTLGDISAVDIASMDPAVRDLPIVTMCDIDNPLCGAAGAAAVFGPQKGADAAMVRRLDGGLAHLASIVRRDLGTEVETLPGAGAAGGMGAGMAAFFRSTLRPGIETVLDTVRFAEVASGADLILTGEGKLDGQSLRGKVISGVARRAGGVPVVAVVGDVGEGAEAVYDLGVTAVFSINRVALPYELSRLRARRDLCSTVEDMMRFLKIGGFPR
ncbi:glycerate kinase [Oscillibacter sp.]|uniref:glycerate kinase family protein n=1 Tax=Oscillibacter sp. TaxID=1945593 RepID=UPI002639BFF1|nr:glycerate kinase [Oscillibacter sp.]MDD3347002.1 glycerate kinase [Oscillibacter sp.]